MRIDFNVLLIDDQPEFVDPHLEALTDKALGEGFKLKIDKVSSVDGAREKLKDEVFQDNIDLVLVDWDLGAGGKGDEALGEIRKVVPYRDIVFYSGAKVVELKNLVLERGIEGVFICHRDALRDKLIGVFESLIKKALDLDHCRGIVMGVTSDIDYLILRMLKLLDDGMQPELKEKATKYVAEKLENKAKLSIKIHEDFKAGGTISAVLAQHAVFTSFNRLGLLREILKHHISEENIDYRNEVRAAIHIYMEEVTKHRNTLGHVSIKESENGRVLLGYDGNELGPQDLRDLRKELIAYRDKFDILANHLGLSEDQLLDAIALIEEDFDDESNNTLESAQELK